MSENHAQNYEDYPRENKVKHRGTQPGFETFPFVPQKVSDQNVTGGIGRRPRKVVKKENAPRHFGNACQKIGGDGWKQGDESCDKNSFGAMTFEKALGPLCPVGREMEPVNVFQVTMPQPPPQPKGPNAAQNAGRRSRRHGLPERTRGFPPDKPGSQKNRLSRQGDANVIQKHNDKDEHLSVMREAG